MHACMHWEFEKLRKCKVFDRSCTRMPALYDLHHNIINFELSFTCDPFTVDSFDFKPRAFFCAIGALFSIILYRMNYMYTCIQYIIYITLIEELDCNSYHISRYFCTAGTMDILYLCWNKIYPTRTINAPSQAKRMQPCMQSSD